jgi:dimethylamine monooxygenase subunit A
MSVPSVPPVDEMTDAARYAPFRQGRYDVKAALASLGTDFGNGLADRQVFQLDASFAAFRQNKLLARAERLAKYDARSPAFSPPVAAAVAAFVVQRLAADHAADFTLTERSDGAVLSCHRTGDELRFDDAWLLVDCTSTTRVTPVPTYVDAFDALMCQVQEDVAVVVRLERGEDEVGAIHLCAANHWSARDKIGQSFLHIHQVVPGMEPVNRRAPQMVDAMIDRGPFVRFVWGIATDTRLNHHPDPAPGHAPAAWHGRRFDKDNPRLYVRVERQVLWGLPEVGAALFAIRPSFRDGAVIRADAELNQALQSGLASMTPEQALYKGVADSRDAVIDWLRHV